MTNRALTQEETYALVELVIHRGKPAQIRTQRRDGSVCWCVVDPEDKTWEEHDEPIIGIATYPPGALG